MIPFFCIHFKFAGSPISKRSHLSDDLLNIVDAAQADIFGFSL